MLQRRSKKNEPLRGGWIGLRPMCVRTRTMGKMPMPLRAYLHHGLEARATFSAFGPLRRGRRLLP